MIRQGKEYKAGPQDGMKEAVWRVWRDPEVRLKCLKGHERETETEERFEAWLTRLDEAREFVNGCRLMLDVYKQVYR